MLSGGPIFKIAAFSLELSLQKTHFLYHIYKVKCEIFTSFFIDEVACRSIDVNGLFSTQAISCINKLGLDVVVSIKFDPVLHHTKVLLYLYHTCSCNVCYQKTTF